MMDSLFFVQHSSNTTEENSIPRLSDGKRQALLNRFQSKIIHNPSLDRTMVSFQANKQTPFFGWFKYREGFSKSLVQYLLEKLAPTPGMLLDPFAGGGSALFAAGELGWSAKGIEILPVGIYAMKARLVASRVNGSEFREAVNKILELNFSEYFDENFKINHIAITRGAYPANEEKALVGYIAYCNKYIRDKGIGFLLLYGAFCILEEMSYTRKDGQYLRWDERSGRSQGKKPFNKGAIHPFMDALKHKLLQMTNDLSGKVLQPSLFDTTPDVAWDLNEQIELISGSCLEVLPKMSDGCIDFVLTSPPYANRYDYTRTYALELVYLGCSDEDVKQLRQTMLSCTVENKDKRAQLKRFYTEIGRQKDFQFIDETFDKQEALQEVLSVLEHYRNIGELNNPHIVRLVRNYFYEMCFVIFEIARVLRSGGTVAMVNDNVRYAGEEIPVDLILSDIAETFGLTTNVIWTLGRGKGNSSQQMGSHGRSELRKCVYVWEKKNE